MNMSDKSIDKLDEEEVALDETLALDSVKTKGKAADMNAVMQLMQAMPEADFNKFVETMNQFAAGKDYGVGDNAMHNATTIMAKEDLDVIFNDSDELSEEFKEKTSTLFEAALGARIAVETSALEEKYESKLQENMDHLVEFLQSNIDTYMDYVVENWMEANEVAIESTLRNELNEEFMEGLKTLFTENYINVPEDRVDVVEALAEQVEDLEEVLHDVLTENHEMKDSLVEAAAASVIEEVSEGLVLSQQDKFFSLAEGVEFDGDLDKYAEKLMTIKEGYFGGQETSSDDENSSIEHEQFDGEEETAKFSDPVVGRYADALARTITK
jgi:hypothetical protein